MFSVACSRKNEAKFREKKKIHRMDKPPLPLGRSTDIPFLFSWFLRTYHWNTGQTYSFTIFHVCWTSSIYKSKWCPKTQNGKILFSSFLLCRKSRQKEKPFLCLLLSVFFVSFLFFIFFCIWHFSEYFVRSAMDKVTFPSTFICNFWKYLLFFGLFRESLDRKRCIFIKKQKKRREERKRKKEREWKRKD